MILLSEIQDQIDQWLRSVSGKISVEVIWRNGLPYLTVRKEEDLQLVIYFQTIDNLRPQSNPIRVPEQATQQIFAFRQSGVSAIVLWEDYWISKKEIIKSRILSTIGYLNRIPGRLTKVRRIDKLTAEAFLEANHLQGAVSSKTQYGLYLPNSYYRILKSGVHFEESADELLVGVATFAGGRVFTNEENSYRSFEMIRFCNIQNAVVVGGINKLLTAFQKDFNPGDVMTYADLEWSNGSNYEKLGFEKKGFKAAIPFWVDCENLVRYRWNDPSQLMQAHLVRQIENMGSLKYVKSFLV